MSVLQNHNSKLCHSDSPSMSFRLPKYNNHVPESLVLLAHEYY